MLCAPVRNGGEDQILLWRKGDFPCRRGCKACGIERRFVKIKEYKKEIETILKDIEKLEAEFEKAKKEALKKWLEYKLQNERTEYLTIPKEFIGKYFYKVS